MAKQDDLNSYAKIVARAKAERDKIRRILEKLVVDIHQETDSEKKKILQEMESAIRQNDLVKIAQIKETIANGIDQTVANKADQ